MLRYACAKGSIPEVSVGQWNWALAQQQMREGFGTMKTLYQTATVDEVKTRLGRLKPQSERLWGKMDEAQMVAHCSIGMELAVGDRRPPRMLIGRILGFLVKPMAFKENEPMRRNSPTIP